MSGEKSLSKRAQVIFKALVERYIKEGQPIGSKTLTEEMGLPLSPATVRNVLADLEAQGYLHAPHTSAGRVPTVRGYRLFVDSLLTIHPPSSRDFQKVKTALVTQMNTENLLATASSLISQMTSLTGIVTIPKQRHLDLSQVEFLPLSGNRVLVVLVFNNQEVQNRIIQTQRVYSASELKQVSDYLNSHFGGMALPQLKRVLKQKMRQDKREINQLLQMAIETPETTREDFVMSGQSHLFDFTDLTDRGRLRELFDAFQQKRDILHLLDQCLHAEGVQIYIGEESGYAPLGGYSMVTAPYTIKDQSVGVLAVIGPTRMAYDRVIPVVDITAKLLSTALVQDTAKIFG